MKVLVVGGGGREHALCDAISKSPLCKKLYCAPGNAGIASVAECLPIAAHKISELVDACLKYHIDFVVIGPDETLALGLSDVLSQEGIPCFGPSRAAAEIEWSKSFMKDLCVRAGVPTAAHRSFRDVEAARTYVFQQKLPVVIKVDGLAAGKGVTVAQTVDAAVAAIDDAMVKKIFGESGTEIIIEEFMVGEEVSFFILSDGTTAKFFSTAQDHKAVFDGDRGPNTGGMGAYSPAPIVDATLCQKIMHDIIEPVLNELRTMGRPFVGVLYAGLMITKNGPKVVEFNARFGDPETQVMLPRLKSDCLSLLYVTAQGRLDSTAIEWEECAALTVIMATKGYPGVYEKGSVIRGLERATMIQDITVYHAGTKSDQDGELTANGGRVLCVTAKAPTISQAQKQAYLAIGNIDWPQGFYRHDIGWRVVANER